MNSTGVKFFTGVSWALQGEVSCGTGCVVCFGALCEVCCGAGNEVFFISRGEVCCRKRPLQWSKNGLFEKPMYDFLLVVNRDNSCKLFSL